MNNDPDNTWYVAFHYIFSEANDLGVIIIGVDWSGV